MDTWEHKQMVIWTGGQTDRETRFKITEKRDERVDGSINRDI
jgi:hypothetical protein